MTGWTLEYVDALSLEDVFEWLLVTDGETKAGNSPVLRKKHVN